MQFLTIRVTVSQILVIINSQQLIQRQSPPIVRNGELGAPSSDNPGNSQPNTDYHQQPAINPAPISTENTSDNAPSSPSSEDEKLFWFWLFVAVGGVALIAYCIYYYLPQSGDQNKKHIFAVSKLQVAMLVGASPGVQSQLTELALNYDVESAADRAEFLQ